MSRVAHANATNEKVKEEIRKFQFRFKCNVIMTTNVANRRWEIDAFKMKSILGYGLMKLLALDTFRGSWHHDIGG
jgi:hypothetical protein